WAAAPDGATRRSSPGGVPCGDEFGPGEIANRVEVFDEPRAIAWQPGTESPESGELSFGGWIWRYDLEAIGPSRANVTLTYDWSAVPPQVRAYLQFPPFGQDHLDNSLQHLSDLVAQASMP